MIVIQLMITMFDNHTVIMLMIMNIMHNNTNDCGDVQYYPNGDVSTTRS